ncbi:MAG: hypothetical protein CSA22_09440 [Deltaproteobacteria bacterium]|nr:MAG: hypothetical protein CSA22_09440 [Deltaproteobacteria bacterium]
MGILAFLILFLLLQHTTPAHVCDNNAQITIQHDDPLGVFYPELLGSNLQWTDKGDGLWTSDGTLQPSALEAVKRLPVAPLRFPGGKLASTYRWRDAVGPLKERRDGLDFLGNLQRSVVGTDEFLHLLTQLKTTGIFTCNIMDPASDAAAWLAYIQEKTSDVVPRWEVGNESYLPLDPSYMTAVNYAEKCKDIIEVLHAVKKDVKVGAILEGSLINVPWATSIMPEAHKWNHNVITTVKDVADFYSVHLYAPLNHSGTYQDMVRAIQTAPLALGKNLEKVSGLVQQFAPGKELWVTEFNLGTDNAQDNWRYGVSLAQAGYVAQMLLQFCRHNVRGATYWSLIGNHNFGMIKNSDNPRLRPAGLLYTMMAELVGGTALKTTVDTCVMQYPVLGNVIENLNPAIVDAQAFDKNGTCYLLAINRMPDATAVLSFRDEKNLPLQVKTATLLFGGNPLDSNENEDNVQLQDAALKDGQLELPACAIALVRFVSR